jgi:hypothetical protein
LIHQVGSEWQSARCKGASKHPLGTAHARDADRAEVSLARTESKYNCAVNRSRALPPRLTAPGSWLEPADEKQQDRIRPADSGDGAVGAAPPLLDLAQPKSQPRQLERRVRASRPRPLLLALSCATEGRYVARSHGQSNLAAVFSLARTTSPCGTAVIPAFFLLMASCLPCSSECSCCLLSCNTCSRMPFIDSPPKLVQFPAIP